MPACTICGQELSFIHQYQQWYCHSCRVYPYLQQAMPQAYYPQGQGMPYPAPYQYQPQYQQHYGQAVQYTQPPAVMPDRTMARNKMFGSFMMRQNTDRVVSTSWVWAILLFQIILPFSAIVTIYVLLLRTDTDFSNQGAFILSVLVFLLVAIALAASHGMLVYKLVKRRDEHFRRDILLREGMAEHLAAVSLETKVDLSVERWTIITLHYMTSHQDRSASLWGVLVALIPLIPIVGIIFLVYSQYFLTKDIQEHDERQRQFNLQYQTGLLKAGLAVEESFVWQPLPRRDMAIYVVVSILTLGLFMPYWWYVNIADMNTHMANQWNFENTLVQKLQAGG